ncbi:hypothetical protein D049_0647B, partial [Vibrio parahaemolyticus VPTS-2010]
NFIDVLVQ